MQEIISFFLEPYKDAATRSIALEFVAAFLGILSVYFAKKENILVFPTGIISTALYVFLLYQWSLYGDLIINIYYTLMSLYGWYMWGKVVQGNRHIAITPSKHSDLLKAFAIFLFTSIFVVAVYRYDWQGNGNPVMPALGWKDSLLYLWEKLSKGTLHDFRQATPYLDSFTTGAAFAAMWLMANKKIENWIFWIAVNIVSVPLYFVKGFGFTGLQYFIFLLLAIQGYKEWKEKINN